MLIVKNFNTLSSQDKELVRQSTTAQEYKEIVENTKKYIL